MEHRNAPTQLSRTLLLTGVVALAGAVPAVRAESGSPAARTEIAATAASAEFHTLKLEQDGRADEQTLNAVTEAVRRDVEAGSKEIDVLIHGFNVDRKEMEEEYAPLAQRLHEEGEASGRTPSVVGVHWAAETEKGWLLKAAGSRLASLVGAKKAVKNPYLQKCDVAQSSGRQGLRALAFRLQDRFPNVPIHLFTHSMGAQVAVAALAPEAGTPDAAQVEQPRRTLRVGMVMLAGADLDQDVFAKENSAANNALGRARLWWVTTPEKGTADGVLELRRGAGKSDAVGNKGLKLTSADLDRLISRRALVLDEGKVPARHRFADYYGERRVRQVALSLRYMATPEDPAAGGSVLASLDQVLSGGPATGKCASARLYAAWKHDGGTGEVDCVALVEPKGGVRVAGMRQETRAAR